MLSLSIENLRAKGWNGISCKHQSTAGTGIEHNPKTHYYSQGSVSFLTAPKHSFPHLTDDVLGRKGPAQHPFNKSSLHLPENQQQERARCGSVRSMDQLRSCVSREWRPANDVQSLMTGCDVLCPPSKTTNTLENNHIFYKCIWYQGGHGSFICFLAG